MPTANQYSGVEYIVTFVQSRRLMGNLSFTGLDQKRSVLSGPFSFRDLPSGRAGSRRKVIVYMVERIKHLVRKDP